MVNSSRAESSTHWPACELTPTPGSTWSCVAPSSLTLCLGLMAMKQPQGQRLDRAPKGPHGLGSSRQTAAVGLDVQAPSRQLWRLLGSEMDGLGLQFVKPWSWWGRPDIPVVKSKASRQTGYPALPLNVSSPAK